MSKQTYAWKRFWCPRNAQPKRDYAGYLIDPESEWGKHCNLELVDLEAIADIPCLVLQGEPGIGKSNAIKEAIDMRANEQDLLVLDLCSFGSEDRLITNLFESSQFKAWAKGSYTLHIFLDSLDECLLRIDNVTAILAQEFKQYQDKVDRLFLRIACRTAVWPDLFEKQLKQIWGEDKVKSYELAPLRWLDVKQTAEWEGIKDSDLFMKEIWDKRAFEKY
jgi:predicted NACHT family NTPase